VRRNASAVTPYYLLAALDHRIDGLGELAPATPDQAIYLDTSPAPSGWAQ
jgi:putative spermidine/putrescine transport system permease protein